MNTNNKKLKIALISKLWESTDPYSIGGTGATVGVLAEGLVARGHEVTLFATGDSRSSAQVIAYKPHPWNNDYSEPIEYLTIADAFNKKYHFDIIDAHVEQKACFFGGITHTPTLINISYGEFFDDERKILTHYKDLNYVAISQALTGLLPELNWNGVIHHGINTDLFPFNEKPEDYLLFIARITPQKGPERAIAVAKKTGKRLIIAGRVAPADQHFFDTEIKPHIDGTQIQFVGLADFSTKIKLFQNAQALLHPINYHEAFGLTIIEALACGTPVISFDNGAPKEIIEHGITGFVVQTIDQMIDSVKKLPTLSRVACRKSVVNRFTADTMVEKYLELYQKIITEHK